MCCKRTMPRRGLGDDENGTVGGRVTGAEPRRRMLPGRPRLAGLGDPTDHRPLAGAHDDRGPADLPVGEAARVVSQRVVAPSEVQDRGFKSRPRRLALGTRVAQGALMVVAPRFAAVAAGFHRLFERAGTHGTDQLAGPPHSRGRERDTSTTKPRQSAPQSLSGLRHSRGLPPDARCASHPDPCVKWRTPAPTPTPRGQWLFPAVDRQTSLVPSRRRRHR
jgi:hypothetical protein